MATSKVTSLTTVKLLVVLLLLDPLLPLLVNDLRSLRFYDCCFLLRAQVLESLVLERVARLNRLLKIGASHFIL